jgi:hypothetical protein
VLSVTFFANSSFVIGIRTVALESTVAEIGREHRTNTAIEARIGHTGVRLGDVSQAAARHYIQPCHMIGCAVERANVSDEAVVARLKQHSALSQVVRLYRVWDAANHEQIRNTLNKNI